MTKILQVNAREIVIKQHPLLGIPALFSRMNTIIFIFTSIASYSSYSSAIHAHFNFQPSLSVDAGVFPNNDIYLQVHKTSQPRRPTRIFFLVCQGLYRLGP
jgi:hypothetical protein